MENNNVPNLTKDKDLVFASFHAKDEANAWRNAADIILKKDYPNRQACILLILSSELYLKSLLMVLGINVMSTFRNNDGHNLFKLYDALPDEELKQAIFNNVSCNEWEIDTGTQKYSINTFDEYLKEISKGFIDYRYEYEKYLNDIIINIPIEFILNLNYILNAICNNLTYEAIYPDGKISDIKKPEMICYYRNKEVFTLHKRKSF